MYSAWFTESKSVCWETTKVSKVVFSSLFWWCCVPGCNKIKLEDARRMEFRGLRRRAPCRRLSGWIAQHRDRSGSPSQLLWLWDLGFCMHMLRSFVYSRRARGCHRGGKMGVKVWDKRRQVVGEDGKGVSSSCTGCSCKPAEKTVLVEIDTWTRKQKANETNNPCRSSKTVLSKRIPNPLG